jgi:hypothetical protein
LQVAYRTKGKGLSEKIKTPLAAEWLVMSECRGQRYDNMTTRSPEKHLCENSEALHDSYRSQKLDLILEGVIMVT